MQSADAQPTEPPMCGGYEHLQSFLCLIALFYCSTASPENGSAVDENAEHVIKVVSRLE